MTPWTVARQAPLSMGFSRLEYWSGLPCPSPGDLPHPGIEPVSLTSPVLAAAAAAAKSPVVSDSVRPRRPWDSPGKNTGVGCHFLLQCTKVKSQREVAQSCPTVHYPMDCSPPGSAVPGILQARVLEWGAVAFSDLRY